MKQITVIPSTIPLHMPITPQARRKVAGYARVSTDQDEQSTSYEAQLDYYTKFIRSHSDWDFVGLYADEGISGLNTKRRDGFNAMIADALAGKISLIVTKSVSRFARNTVDSLTTIRTLKAHGIEVFFEKENIWTFDSKGELLITLMSSLAQEESRSISENVTWGQRKRMQDGKVSFAYSRFLGYRKGEDGKPEVVPEEAEVVRRIYRMFMEGMTIDRIAKALTREGIPTPAGRTKWQKKTVESILLNEKYKGEALLQKVFTVDFLTKKVKKNEGEVPQYYVKGSHPGIISPEEWQLVQDEMKRRKAKEGYHHGLSPFAGKIFCGECGAAYGPKVWHSNDPYRKVIWRCNEKYHKKGKNGEAGEHCTTPHLTEEEIKATFCRALGELVEDRDRLAEDVRLLRAELADTGALESKREALTADLAQINSQIAGLIQQNAATAQDQAAYTLKYNELSARYEKKKKRLDTVTREIENRTAKARALDSFILELGDSFEVEFSAPRFNAMVERVDVLPDGQMVFRFVCGREIVV